MKRITLLQKAFRNFQCASQWVTSNPSQYVEFLNKAESIIEILEIEDCGSVGGFDKENKCKTVTGFKLYDRFLTVIRKRNKYSDLKEECDFTVENLGEYYKNVHNLRSNIFEIIIQQ
jgi:hypothetical protein